MSRAPLPMTPLNKPFSEFRGEVVLLILACLGPFQGMVSFLSIPLGRLGISIPISITGVFNFICILIYSGILLPVLFRSFRLSPPNRWEYLLMAWPVLTLINMKSLERSSLVSLENACLWSLLLLAFVRRRSIIEFTLQIKHAYQWVLFSFFIAFILPLVVPVSGVSLYRQFGGGVDRYMGWANAGCLSMMSVVVVEWAILNLLRGKSSGIKNSLLSFGGIFLALFVLHYLVTRISVAACVLLLFGGSSFLWKLARRKDALVTGVLLLFGILSHFSFRYMQKSHLIDTSHFGQSTEIDKSPLSSPVLDEIENKNLGNQKPAMILLNWIKMAKQSKFLSFNAFSNGRVQIDQVILNALRGHWLRGLGTGKTVNVLIDGNITSEPHNDYLRVLGDFGLLGLGFLLIIMGRLAYMEWNSFDFFVLMAMAVIMLTDNFYVYPVFGYGPMFSGLFLFQGKGYE
jgi:hypothetical protein